MQVWCGRIQSLKAFDPSGSSTCFFFPCHSFRPLKPVNKLVKHEEGGVPCPILQALDTTNHPLPFLKPIVSYCYFASGDFLTCSAFLCIKIDPTCKSSGLFLVRRL
jgi:hypothetical protein